MSSLATRLAALATAVGTDIKALSSASGIGVTTSGLVVVAHNNIQAALADLDAAEAKSIRRNQPSWVRTGALAETLDRRYLNSNTIAPTSGQLRCSAIEFTGGEPVGHAVFVIGAVNAVTPTHSFAVLLDSNYVVRAVSADRTTGAYPGVGAELTFNFTTYNIPAGGGKYWLGVSCVAATQPQYSGVNSQPAAQLDPSIGINIAAQSTPPALGATLTPTVGQTSIYAYVTV